MPREAQSIISDKISGSIIVSTAIATHSDANSTSPQKRRGINARICLTALVDVPSFFFDNNVMFDQFIYKVFYIIYNDFGSNVGFPR